MIALEILVWWYRQGWMQVAKNAEARVSQVYQLFAIPILVRTWFEPWRRIITYPGAGIDAQLRAMTDNLVSRLVGFTVRSVILLTVGILLLGCVLLTLLQVVFWPLLPLIAMVAIVLGLIG